MAKGTVVEFNRQSAVSAVKRTLTSRTHTADIIANETANPPIFHFIVTGKDSPEIIYWGQTQDLNEAIDAAQAMLKFYEGRAASVSQ
jgi:hypothetical protein